MISLCSWGNMSKMKMQKVFVIIGQVQGVVPEVEKILAAAGDSIARIKVDESRI